MAHLLKWYKWVNILSIDVAAGAVASAGYFVILFSLPIKPVGLIVLGLSVWVIYTADHLKDAYHIIGIATTERHRFHQQNFKLLSILIGVAFAVIVMLAFRMDKNVAVWGFRLSALVALYLICNRYLSFLKEIMAALLYCAGVFLPALIRTGSAWDFLLQPEVTLFAPLVLINLLLFSYFETVEDAVDNHKSFALYFGKPSTISVVKFLLAASLIILVVRWTSMPVTSRMLFIVMNGVLISITLFRNFFKDHSRYRYWGDSIFLFPAMALLA